MSDPPGRERRGRAPTEGSPTRQHPLRRHGAAAHRRAASGGILLALLAVVASTWAGRVDGAASPSATSAVTASGTARPTPSPSVSASPSPSPCETSLQSIVDGARPGSVIRLPACTSTDQLQVDRPLSIDAHGTVIDGLGVLTHAVVVTANDVEIDGLTVTRAANPPQDGAVRAWDVSGFVFRGGTITDSAGACISVARSPGAIVADSTFAGCGQEGIHATRADGLEVRNDRIHGNNPNATFDPEWEAGGAKVTRSDGVKFVGNEVWGNQGPGLWCDIDCRQLVVSGNRVWDNTRAGIQVEISDGATVDRNQVWENGWGKTTFGWGAGILISSSRAVSVTANTVAWNADGIVVISQDRSDAPSPIDRVTTSKNVVAMTGGPDAFGLGWLQDWGGTLFLPASGNGGSGDAFWFDVPEGSDARFAWSGRIERLADFRATPGGRGAAYVDATALDAILASAGIPVHPGPGHAIAVDDRRTLVVAALLGAVAAGLAAALWYLARRRRARRRGGEAADPA